MKIGIIGTSITALHYGLKLADKKNKIQFIDESGVIGGAWASRKIFNCELEFGWHSLVAENRSEILIKKVTDALMEYGVQSEIINAKFFIENNLDKRFTKPLKSLEPSISWAKILDIMKQKLKHAGSEFELNTSIKQVHVTGKKVIAIDQNSSYRKFDKLVLGGFSNIHYINVNNEKKFIPGEPRLSIHAVIKLTEEKLPTIPPIAIDNPDVSFDLLREIFPKVNKNDNSRFLVARVSRSFKALAMVDEENLRNIVLNDLNRIGLPLNGINEAVDFQFYPIIYRSDECVKNINQTLPKEVQLYRSQDLFKTLI